MGYKVLVRFQDVDGEIYVKGERYSKVLEEDREHTLTTKFNKYNRPFLEKLSGDIPLVNSNNDIVENEENVEQEEDVEITTEEKITEVEQEEDVEITTEEKIEGVEQEEDVEITTEEKITEVEQEEDVEITTEEKIEGVEQEEVDNKEQYNNLTVVELKKLADSEGIEYNSKIRKDELIDKLI